MDSCHKISREEYDYQANVITKQEIAKLVQSEAYKKAMESKGLKVEEWNWQVMDRMNGIYPKDVKQEDENFDLVQEISKVDEGNFDLSESS